MTTQIRQNIATTFTAEAKAFDTSTITATVAARLINPDETENISFLALDKTTPEARRLFVLARNSESSLGRSPALRLNASVIHRNVAKQTHVSYLR